MGDITNREPYQQAYYPPTPTGSTRFMRTCLLWQIYRFFAINIKMLKLIAKSHHLAKGSPLCPKGTGGFLLSVTGSYGMPVY